MIRRHFILGSASAAIAGAAYGQTAPVMRVAKTPTCGCCGAWVSTVVDAGLSVDIEDVESPDNSLRYQGHDKSCRRAL